MALIGESQERLGFGSGFGYSHPPPLCRFHPHTALIGEISGRVTLHSQEGGYAIEYYKPVRCLMKSGEMWAMAVKYL